MTSETVYFGTYTKKTSQGIYQAEFNSKTGALADLTLIAQETSPTYLAFAADGCLYSVGYDNGQGGIASFDQHFKSLNHVVSEGAGLCYLSVDDKRGLVYGANYHKGQVLIYQRQEDGSLALLQTLQHQGSGPHPNQSTSHVHFAGLTPDKYLIVCDLGTDSVVTYDFDSDGHIHEIGNYQSQAGAGPRHIVFHPSLKVAYLICELNATVEVLIYDGYGQFEHYQTISTLPEDFHGHNACAAIRLSSDGKFLYASNRGHDSLAVFKVVGDGVLERIQIISTAGLQPRDFNLTPDENFVIAVHQDSDNATVFKRNQTTGLLTELNHDFQVPEAVCITFRK